MTLAERLVYTLARLNEPGQADWLLWMAEFDGLAGRPPVLSRGVDCARVLLWWTRAAEDRAVLLGLEQTEDNTT